MRKAYFFIIAAITLLALLLVPFMVGIAKSDSSQPWLLTDTAAGISADDDTTHVCDNTMYKAETDPPCQGTNYKLTSNVAAWWYSEQKAECNVTFGEDSWFAEIYVQSIFPGSLQAQVWSVNATGHRERLLAEGTGDVSFSIFPQEVPIECVDNPLTQHTVLEDHRIALRLSFSPIGTARVYLCHECCGTSRLHSPESNPGYPLPELPAIVMLAGGLGCLAGYVAFRRWRAGADSSDGQRSQG